jgi:broad specificity phosphatase PhoE
MRRFIFISHPDVVVNRDVPIPQWPLSEVGFYRMKVSLQQPWVSDISAVYCSSEQKSIDGAKIVAEHLSLNFVSVTSLGENDRSSTGFLPPQEFEMVADEFFAKPEVSVRGWETAADAQTRIVKAIMSIADSDQSSESIAIVSHGAVGALLYCYLAGEDISRRWDQPPTNGGNYYSFQTGPEQVFSWWKPIDDLDLQQG